LQLWVVLPKYRKKSKAGHSKKDGTHRSWDIVIAFRQINDLCRRSFGDSAKSSSKGLPHEKDGSVLCVCGNFGIWISILVTRIVMETFYKF